MTEERELRSDAAVARAWNANAARWSEDLRAGYDRFRDLYTMPAFLDFIPDLAGCEVLEIGCGDGTSSRRFAALGSRLTAVDLSAAMIERARAEEACEPLGIHYLTGSAAQLDEFGSGRFDHALSFMALMDAADLRAIIDETRRLLKPGGTLAFSVLHPCFMTRAYGWKEAEDRGSQGLVVGRYFEKEPWLERWRFSANPESAELEPFVVPRFCYTLSDYLNTLADAGFRIDRIAEPRPSEAAVEEHPSFQRWRQHAPLVLFVSARKLSMNSLRDQ